MNEINRRLLESLIKQLKYEIMFVKDVSKLYYNFSNKMEIVEFKYRNMSCKLVLNGKLMLETEQRKTHIESFQDLIEGLIQSNYPKKNTG